MTDKSELSYIDFQYRGVEVEYNRTVCNGQCEYMCRCTQITNANIKSVDLQSIVTEITKHLKNKDVIFKYCVERILQAHRCWSEDFWHINICGGYYGQEIGKIVIDNNECLLNLQELGNLIPDNHRMIEYVLELEYDYLLPELRNLVWEVKTINFNELNFGADRHVSMIKKSDLRFYKGHTGPLGIVIGNNRVIDGYHRLMASNRKKVEILYGTPRKK